MQSLIQRMHQHEKKQITINLDIIKERRRRERCPKTQIVKSYLLSVQKSGVERPTRDSEKRTTTIIKYLTE